MERIFIAIALGLVVGVSAGAPRMAEQTLVAVEDSCEIAYTSQQGDTVETIAARAYDGAATMLLLGRNPHLHPDAGPLAIGTDIRLPCLAGLDDLTPKPERLAAQFTVSATE
ncbi:MAG: hypothetical protein AAF360_06940 [Pseudomonadota bacterium]